MADTKSSIRVSFSIADLNTLDPESDYQDTALGDEEGAINQGDGKNFKVAPEDSIEEGNEEELDQDSSFPVRLNVVIEKAGKGALGIETIVQNGMVQIQNLHHYADAALAHGQTADSIHKAQSLYLGPPFENLDEDLQVYLERYLDERGINTAMAVFVPEYIDMKEQNEYVKWLSNVKTFVE
jgi:complement component 1 Q subcomponent-binding protein